jgi:hypothetical protein
VWNPSRSLPAGRACGYDSAPWGDWLSRLERPVHIRKVTGSNPVSPTTPFPRPDGAWAARRCACTCNDVDRKYPDVARHEPVRSGVRASTRESDVSRSLLLLLRDEAPVLPRGFLVLGVVHLNGDCRVDTLRSSLTHTEVRSLGTSRVALHSPPIQPTHVASSPSWPNISEGDQRQELRLNAGDSGRLGRGLMARDHGGWYPAPRRARGSVVEFVG